MPDSHASLRVCRLLRGGVEGDVQDDRLVEDYAKDDSELVRGRERERVRVREKREGEKRGRGERERER